jgi:hypothetical protein
VTPDQTTQIQLPDWLNEALIEGDPTDATPNKRHEGRTISALYCLVERPGMPGQPLSARVFNVSPQGLGMITRTSLQSGQRVRLLPGDGLDGAPVEVVVVHCTQTVQGFKVGCSFQLNT